MAEPKVRCRTPTKGRDGATAIPEWKFTCIREAIRAELSQAPCAFNELTSRVAPRLTEQQKADMGSLGWHVTTVKLELEVRGEIERVEGAKPQQLRLAG